MTSPTSLPWILWWGATLFPGPGPSQQLPRAPWDWGLLRELPFAGKPQYFALVGGKSWAVERAAWPKPSGANTDMIYFVADNLALFFPAPQSVMGPQLGRLVLVVTCWRAGLKPMRGAHPLCITWQSLGVPPGVGACWANGDRDWAILGPPAPGPSPSILSSRLGALLQLELLKGHQSKQGSWLHSISRFPLRLPPDSAALSSRTER